MQIFKMNSYVDFILKKIEENSLIRGYRSLLAKEAGCHRSYFSQVLSGNAELTMDQAANLASYWGLSEAVSEYFILMVSHQKAGTEALKKLLQRRMTEIKKKTTDNGISNQNAQILPAEHQLKYYGHWYYSAIHMLITTSKFWTASAVSQRLGLPLRVVEEAITSLESMLLIRRNKSAWRQCQTHTFLPGTAAMASSFHLNWRQRAIHQMQNQEPLLFTATHLYGISENDVQEFRKQLSDVYENFNSMSLKSKEEEVVTFTCDLFRAK